MESAYQRLMEALDEVSDAAEDATKAALTRAQRQEIYEYFQNAVLPALVKVESSVSDREHSLFFS